MAWNKLRLKNIIYGTFSMFVFLVVALTIAWMSYFAWLPSPNNFLINQSEYQKLVDTVENADIHEFIYEEKPLVSYSANIDSKSIGRIVRYMNELKIDSLDSRQPTLGIELQLKKRWWSNKVTLYLYKKEWINIGGIPNIEIYEKFDDKWIRFDFR